jgi:putative ABC transport system permease protein
VLSYVWRQLFQRKVRTGLSMLGVSVSVAGIVAMLSISAGLLESLDDYMVQTGADLLVFSRDAGGLEYSNVPGECVEAIRKMEGVEEIARANFTILGGPKLAERHKLFPVLPCFGRFWDERLIRRYEPMLKPGGRLPKKRSEILVGAVIAEKVGFRVGDRMPLFRRVMLDIEEYEVVGIFESEINWENTGLVVHGDVVRTKLGRDSYNIVFVYAPEGPKALATAIETRFEDLVALPPDQFTQQFSERTEVIEDFVAIIAVVAIVIGVLGVLNTMMMSVSERTREIGMLRALGWSRGLVVKAILAEGILLSAVGGAVGLLLGVAGTEALLRYSPGGFLEAAYTPDIFVKGAVIALVVGVFAAIYPALRAANLRPVEALRYE